MSTYRYLGPFGFMVVLGQPMGIGDTAELDDDFIKNVNNVGKHRFELVPTKSFRQDDEGSESNSDCM